MRWLTLFLLVGPDAGLPARDCSAIEPTGAATSLCDEHVSASRGEVHWRSWSLAEPPDAVFETYRKLAERCGGTVELKQKRVKLGRHDVAIFAPGTPGVPSCGKDPAESARTVVLISTFTAR